MVQQEALCEYKIGILWFLLTFQNVCKLQISQALNLNSVSAFPLWPVGQKSIHHKVNYL